MSCHHETDGGVTPDSPSSTSSDTPAEHCPEHRREGSLVAIAAFLLVLFRGTTDAKGTFIGGMLPVWNGTTKRTTWCKDIGEADTAIGEISASGHNAYISVALHDPDLALKLGGGHATGKSHPPELSRVRGSAGSATVLVGLWSDEDHGEGAHKKEGLPPDPDTVLGYLRKVPAELRPSVVLDTGGGFHPWLLFEEPWALDDEEERNRAQSLTRQYSAYLGDHVSVGYTRDSVHDLARVMRPAGTVNAKYGTVVTPVDLDTGQPIELDDGVRRVNPSDVESFLDEIGVSATEPQKVAPDATAGVDLVLAPDAEPPIEKIRLMSTLDAGFSQVWTREKRFPSQSEYDLSIAARLLAAGFEDQEVVDALIAHRRESGAPPKLRADYYARTLKTARSAGIDAPPTAGSNDPGDQEPPRRSDATKSAPLEYVPFPIEVLPPRLAQIIVTIAKAVGCDPAFVAVPLITSAAAAIGNTRDIQLKQGWKEPPVIWSAIVADSGTLKSPALDKALGPVVRKEARAEREHRDELALHEREIVRYEAELRKYKNKPSGDPPDKPKEPVQSRYRCVDATVEALSILLHRQPRGLLLARDELAGWLKGFDQYKSGKGNDATHFIEMHGARPITIDRKTGRPQSIYIPRAALSITGGIQPDILKRTLEPQYFESGLAARLLLTLPPSGARRWTDAHVKSKTERDLERIFEGLYGLESGLDEEGEPIPKTILLGPEAHGLWVEFYNRTAREQELLHGKLRAAWSKLEGYGARFTLVLHLLVQACGDPSTEEVGRKTMANGIVLTEWFKNETRRVEAIFSETEDERDLRERIDVIRRQGGQVSVRDWQRLRSSNSSEDAKQELQLLVDSGLARWRSPKPGPKGGAPSLILKLLDRTPADAHPGGVLSVSESGGSGNHNWEEDATELQQETPLGKTTSGETERGVLPVSDLGGVAEPPDREERIPVETPQSEHFSCSDNTHSDVLGEGVLSEEGVVEERGVSAHATEHNLLPPDRTPLERSEPGVLSGEDPSVEPIEGGEVPRPDESPESGEWGEV